jgi:hypothetical protein
MPMSPKYFLLRFSVQDVECVSHLDI